MSQPTSPPNQPPPPPPFSFLYANAQSFPQHEHASWLQRVGSASATSPIPQLYAFVESGRGRRPAPPGWSAEHLDGPAAGARGVGGGGISLYFHQCAVKVVTRDSIPPLPSTTHPHSTAVLIAIVHPLHRAPFLLATCYLPPQVAASNTHYVAAMTAKIEVL